MKRLIAHLALAAVLSCLFPLASCTEGAWDDGVQARISLRFEGDPRQLSKVWSDVPDTNDFLLTVSSEEGRTVYDGVYSGLPDYLEVQPGSYSIFVRSGDFDRPAFSSPQYGDMQCVKVAPGETVTARLDCRQTNAGIRLEVDPGFLVQYPEGVLFVRSGEHKLMYSYREDRIAYFNPGKVSVVLVDGMSEEVLMTRNLFAQEVLSVKISVASADPHDRGGMKICLDTARVWTHESLVIGGGVDKGGESGDALSVADALHSVGTEDVWVSGFIVGGDLTRTSARFEPPFRSASNLLLASRSRVSSREQCIAVQLSAGEVRDAVNLAEHPEMLGRQVCLKGDLVEPYFGLVGLKSVSGHILK